MIINRFFNHKIDHITVYVIMYIIYIDIHNKHFTYVDWSVDLLSYRHVSYAIKVSNTNHIIKFTLTQPINT
jgi:hypothetical protein